MIYCCGVVWCCYAFVGGVSYSARLGALLGDCLDWYFHLVFGWLVILYGGLPLVWTLLFVGLYGGKFCVRICIVVSLLVVGRFVSVIGGDFPRWVWVGRQCASVYLRL